MKQLFIGKPHIKEMGQASRLEAAIYSEDFSENYFFEVEKRYGDSLCDERGDAFVLGLFYFALVNGYDIVSEAPMSERLYYQLTLIYIPTVVKNDPDLFKSISITAELDPLPVKNQGAVGTAASGGVDSFYTILKNRNNKAANYNVTHLILTNSFNIYYDAARTRKRFREICVNAEKIARDLRMDLVKIYSNEHNFWYPHYVDLYCFRYISLIYALQKLFSVFHYSTGYQYRDFTFKAVNRDASHYDFFTAHLISSENLTIYSFGGEAGRPEKAGYIADNPVVQRRLQVCNLHTENCSVCEKCLRTQFNLYAHGKLESFEQVFRIDEFYKRKDRTLMGMLSVRGSFEKENLSLLEKNHIPIPLRIRILGNIGYCCHLFRRTFKRIPVIFKIYQLLKKEDSNSELAQLKRYNLERDFAKECNPEIVKI